MWVVSSPRDIPFTVDFFLHALKRHFGVMIFRLPCVIGCLHSFRAHALSSHSVWFVCCAFVCVVVSTSRCGSGDVWTSRLYGWSVVWVHMLSLQFVLKSGISLSLSLGSLVAERNVWIVEVVAVWQPDVCVSTARSSFRRKAVLSKQTPPFHAKRALLVCCVGSFYLCYIRRVACWIVTELNLPWLSPVSRFLSLLRLIAFEVASPVRVSFSSDHIWHHLTFPHAFPRDVLWFCY